MLNSGKSSHQYGKEKTHSPWRHTQGLAKAGGQPGVTASRTRGKRLHPAIPSHSALFMATINTLTTAALVAQIFTSFPNESRLFFLPALSRFMERRPKIAPGLWLRQHFFLAPSLYFFLTYIKLQGLCRIQVCLVTSSLKSQYHLESALTLHLDRHNIMYNSILHKLPYSHVKKDKDFDC